MQGFRQFLNSTVLSDVIARKFFLVVSLFVVIVVTLFTLDRFQAYVLDSIRAYVAGEGFWSKSQKDAVYHLVRYANFSQPEDYQAFHQGMLVNQGDRKARLAMQAQKPDLNQARAGFLAGNNHPDDIDRMISFFLNFSDVSEMKEAIAIWTEADGKIDRMIKLGEAIHTHLQSASPDRRQIEVILHDVDQLHDALDQLERRFSATLGKAARKIESLTEWVMLIATLLLLVMGIMLSIQIVQGLRRTQQALEVSESRFRHVVESNIVGIMFWRLDGSIFDANDAFLNIIGYSRSDLEAGRVNWQSLTPPESHEVDNIALRELEEFRVCKPYEKLYLHRDGHHVAVYLSAALFADSADSGVCFALDISERKRAEQAQRLAATVFESTREGILVTDANACIKAVNPAFSKVTGYDASEVIGKNPSMLSSGQHDAAFYTSMWNRLHVSRSWKGEVWNRRKNGEIYHEWLSITAIVDEAGEVIEYVGVFSDITEQRQLEEQVRQAQKMEAIGTLVGGIAHDFNNTLAAMQGNLFLAQRYNQGHEPVSAKLEIIQGLLDHSAEMVAQLLTFARKGIVQMRETSLTELFAKLEYLTRSIIPENIEFEMCLSAEKLVVHGDATQLQQLMLNLLNNARDAVEQSVKPRIHCSINYLKADHAFLQTHPEIESVELAHIEVRDNGCGISPEQLAHIFEPFYTTKEVGKGTGLGMSMVYGSVQTHNGVIEIESELGHGTTIHLYLPLTESHNIPAVAETYSHPCLPDQAHKATVLLADDNEHIRNFCSELLLEMGLEVLIAQDGSDALEQFMAYSGHIDLVVSDVVMPHMGGFQAVAKMREHQGSLPAIFMTGYDPAQTEIPQALCESSTILSKPFDMKDFVDQVSQMLDTIRER